MTDLVGSHTPWLILSFLQYFFIGMMWVQRKYANIYLSLSLHFGLLALVATGLSLYVDMHR